MHVRCPHCRNPIEIVDDSSFKEIPCPTCGSSFSLIGGGEVTEVYQGGRKIGHFELIEQLGVGQFGSVWKAKDTQLDRTVAIKMPRKGQLSDTETEGFLREARAAAQLRHANIVSVHEVGKDDDSVYIVSDYIEGADLKKWLRGEPVPPREAAELCAKIAEALHTAHEQGVVHRDLKPGNIMMDLKGEPHIMDFGLAKRESGEITMTVEGALLGTPAYMSPEQARGEAHEADRRSDVYSLGVILFEMLTGELPFRGEKRMLIVQILTEDPQSPRQLAGNLPRDLETICLKCMGKEPGRRYQTGHEFAADLNRFLRGEPIHARPVSRAAKVWRWCKRKPTAAGLIATAAVLLVTVVAGSVWIAIQGNKYVRDMQEQQTRRALAQLDALRSAAPDGVPYLIETLRPAREAVAPRLRQVFQDETADPIHRLHAAMALLTFDKTDVDPVEFLVSQVAVAKTAECANVVSALKHSREASLQSLADAILIAHESESWTTKARLAIVALHLGDTEPASDMLQFEERPDPIQRTVFIETIPKWNGNLYELAEQLRDTNDPGLCSGISLAVGSVEDVSDPAQQVWQEVFAQWYVNQPDAGTHSAAGWALRNWKLDLPEILESSQQRDNDWQLTPMGLTMLRIPAGEFLRETRDTNSKEQTVRITDDFLLSDQEITVGLFQQFMDDADYEGKKPEGWEAATEAANPTTSHPAQNVNWYDAVMFCNWLSRREGRTPCYGRTGEKETIKTLGGGEEEHDAWRLIDAASGYRLPSEAQWEYGCRAGTTTTFGFGEDEARLSQYAVYIVKSLTSATGSKFCNPWGLFDMHGNVREWCEDWYEGDSDVSPGRVNRGGSFYSPARYCESSDPNSYPPMFRYRIMGFRVARVPSASKKPASGAESESQ